MGEQGDVFYMEFWVHPELPEREEIIQLITVTPQLLHDRRKF